MVVRCHRRLDELPWRKEMMTIVVTLMMRVCRLPRIVLRRGARWPGRGVVGQPSFSFSTSDLFVKFEVE